MNRYDAWITAFASLLFLVIPGSSSAQCSNGPINVLMGQYDDSRDSVNSNETCLTPASSTFYAADGVTPTFVQQAAFPSILTGTTQSIIFAQPLYVQNVVIGGVTHNIVYVAALNGVVYAYDADNYGSGSPPSGVLYWARWLTKDCNETVGGVNYPGQLTRLGSLPYLGILSTPVIDRATGIIFVVNACNVTGPSHRGVQWFLNALKINSGKPAIPPVMIAGTVTNSLGSTVFNPGNELQRPALLLTKDSSGSDEVYIAFGAGVAEGPTEPDFHGWLFEYSVNSGALVQQSVFTSTPVSSVFSTMCDPVILSGYPLPPNWCGQAGGIWMSGRGPAAAMINGSVQVFLAVSNGGFQNVPATELGGVGSEVPGRGRLRSLRQLHALRMVSR